MRRIAKGSGTKQEKVEQVIQQFNMMRGMMQQFSEMGGGGLLNKIPGLKQHCEFKQMKDMDMNSLLGDLMGGGQGGMGGMGGGPNLPPGYTPPGGHRNPPGSKSKSM